jgi:hypothetical protein
MASMPTVPPRRPLLAYLAFVGLWLVPCGLIALALLLMDLQTPAWPDLLGLYLPAGVMLLGLVAGIVVSVLALVGTIRVGRIRIAAVLGKQPPELHDTRSTRIADMAAPNQFRPLRRAAPSDRGDASPP